MHMHGSLDKTSARACVHDRLAGHKKIEFKATVNLHADQVGGLPKRDKNKILPRWLNSSRWFMQIRESRSVSGKNFPISRFLCTCSLARCYRSVGRGE